MRLLRAAVAVGVAVAALIPLSSQGRRANRIARVHGREVVDGEVIVKFRPAQSQANRLFVEGQLDLDDAEFVSRHGMRRLHSHRLSTEDLLARLQGHPDIEYAEPNYILYATQAAAVEPDFVLQANGEDASILSATNDPMLGSLFGLINTGQSISGAAGVAGADIYATKAWALSTGSASTVVGVIDTGVDYTHPDLAANIWSAPAPFSVTIGGQTINCGAGTHGFNAITNACDPMDDQFHGTHVSGTIGAVGNNSLGVVGVNWTTSIMGLKFLGSNGSGATSDAVKAIEFAIQAKAAFSSTHGANVRVLSNSWGGGGFSQALLDEIASANANDMLFVAAAGNATWDNDTMPAYPANYNVPNVVSVAATDNRDQLASFSDYGATTVHLAAPGVNISSTYPGAQYASLSGTSMATPHVSGAAALVLARCSLNTAALKAILVNTVDPVAALAGKTITGGRLNVGRAMQQCISGPVASVSIAADQTAPKAPSTTINWTATASGGTAPLQYQWVVYDGTTWTSASSWSTSNTFAWTPATNNSAYQVGVWTRSDANRSNRSEKSAATPFAITQAAVSAVSLAADLTSPQQAGTTITWTATPTGGVAPIQYQWLVYDGATWTPSGTWTTSNTFAWRPVTAGSAYQVGVWTRSAGNLIAGSEKSAAVPFAVTSVPPISAVSLTPSVASPQPLNTPITWTASASGGLAPYQYQFLVFDGTTWNPTGAWTTSNTWVWTPTSASSVYQVGVWTRSAGNTANQSEKSAAVAYTITPRVTSVSLTSSLVSPQAPNTTITWTATPGGGVAPYQYQWLVYDGATWNNVGSWTSSNTFAWTPAQAGSSYQVGVWTRGAGNSNNASEKSAAAPFAIQSRVSAVSLSANATAPVFVNTTVSWTATPTGGVAPIQYQWLVYDGVTWNAVGGWTTTNTFAWTPATANASYQVGVWTRSAGNTNNQSEKSAAVPFAVNARVTAVSLSANLSAPQPANTTINWTATPTSGTAPIQYQWLVYDGANWNTVGSWTTSNTFAWTPTQAGASYQVGVWTRSSGNTANASEKSAAAAFAITVARVTSVSLTADASAPRAVNATVTWTATPTGGTAPIQYQWLVYDGTTWNTVGGWTTTNTFAWTPTTANASYQVGVWTRSSGNTANASEKSAAVPFAVARVTSVSLSANRAAPQAASTTVTWTATPSGGAAPYEYQWLVFDGTTWNTVGSWTSSNTFAWTPSQANANYQVGVWTRGAGDTANASEKSAAVLFAIQ